MKKCPFCSELIQTDAIKCRYCGEFLRKDPPTQPGGLPTRSSPLRTFGILLCVLGLLAAFYFFAVFDTSVEVPTKEIAGQTIGGGRVSNIGLMSQRQNGIIIAGIVAVIGIALFAVGQSRVGGGVLLPPRRVAGGLECPNCRLISPEGTLQCDCGFVFRGAVQR